MIVYFTLKYTLRKTQIQLKKIMKGWKVLLSVTGTATKKY